MHITLELIEQPVAELSINDPVAKITAQFRSVTGAFDALFLAASPRSDKEAWRIEGEYKGTGSCKNVTKGKSEEFLTGTAAEHIIWLREEQNNDSEGDSTVSDCPYHREGSGCILGDLKGPLCIAFIDNPSEWAERFGIDGYFLSSYIHETLRQVLAGGKDENGLNPDRNDPLVEEAVAKAEYLKSIVKEHPILHPEELETDDEGNS